MLHLTVTASRTVKLHHFSGSTFSTGELLDSISLYDPAIHVSSNLLAYRPSFSDNHGSNLAVMFVNMEAIFPCTDNLGPVCHIITHEADGFNQGRPFIESGDLGNHFQIFSSPSTAVTYGFAIQGCTQMDPTCLRSPSQLVIECFLPRHLCH